MCLVLFEKGTLLERVVYFISGFCTLNLFSKMELMQVDNLQVGAYGWDHESWVGNFYPEDMPAEWRLDFYANSFRTILVPQSVWSLWDEEQIEEVAEAVEGEFGFYFELKGRPSAEQLSQLAQITKQFHKLAQGIVLFSEESFSEQTLGGLPVTLFSKTQRLNGWCWQHEGWSCSGNPCGVVQLLTSDAKLQAALLKDFMASLPESNQGAPFIVCDEQLDMTQLNSLKVIGELLGY